MKKFCCKRNFENVCIHVFYKLPVYCIECSEEISISRMFRMLTMTRPLNSLMFTGVQLVFMFLNIHLKPHFNIVLIVYENMQSSNRNIKNFISYNELACTGDMKVFFKHYKFSKNVLTLLWSKAKVLY